MNRLTTIDDILHPGEARRSELASLDANISRVNQMLLMIHAMKAIDPPAQQLPVSDKEPGQEADTTSGTAAGGTYDGRPFPARPEHRPEHRRDAEFGARIRSAL